MVFVYKIDNIYHVESIVGYRIVILYWTKKTFLPQIKYTCLCLTALYKFTLVKT